MSTIYDDNTCINFELTDTECGNTHDIRPGGADGTAGTGDEIATVGVDDGGIYDGSVSIGTVNYLRKLPCGPIDLKAFRTLFYRIFKFIDDQRCSEVGKFDWFCTPAAPTGWLVCNGQAVSRTEYPRLFERIGTLYGAGDGSLTFNVPDVEGRQVRAYDPTRKIDSNFNFDPFTDEVTDVTTRGFGTQQDGSLFPSWGGKNEIAPGRMVIFQSTGDEGEFVPDWTSTVDLDTTAFEPGHRLRGIRVPNIAFLPCIRY